MLLKFLPKAVIAALMVFYTTVHVKAQTWAGNCPTWGTCNISASPATGNTTTLNFAPYYQWATFSYTLATPLNISSNATVTFGLNTGVGSAVAGKFLVLTLTDAASVNTSLNPYVVVEIPSTGSLQTYSVDFKLAAPASFNFAQVNKLSFWIASDRGTTSSPGGISSGLTIANVQFGNGVPGFSTQTNPSVGQLWNLTSTNGMVNTNTGNVQIGDFTNVGVSTGLLNPYYKFIVSGRSNFIGNDNAFSIWSATANGGARQYLGISNTAFPSGGPEYTSITSSAWTGSAGIPKPLTLQNFEDINGTGNVGIGYHAGAPVSKLSVNGNVQVGTVLTPYGSEGSRLYFGGLDENSDRLYFTRYNTSDNATTLRLHIGDDAAKNDVFEIGSKYYADGLWKAGVRISSSGSIVAKEVCVNATLDWCDYVFEKDYRLMSVRDLKSYISLHKHLPEIPSADEIKKSGLNVNLLLTMHMKKIEELTLYTISQDEKIEQLEQRLNSLEKLLTGKE